MGFSNRVGGDGPLNGGKMGSGHNLWPQLNHNSIESVIDQFSVAIKYWKAIQCPCMNPDSGQPDIACSSCRGLGWYYSDEPESDTIYQRSQVHSRKSQRLSEKGGMLTQGYSSITFLPGVIPGEGDLVQICKDREVINEEYHVVGAKLNNGSTAEQLRFRDVICVEYVVYYNPFTKQVVKAEPSEYTFNTTTRKIDWNINLTIGSKYSVRYLARPEYILRAETAKPLLRVAHDDNLPDPARVRKDIVYPFNVQAIRLDRALLERQKPSTGDGGGVFL